VTSTTGWGSGSDEDLGVSRDAMGSLAPGVEPTLLDEAEKLLLPLWDVLGSQLLTDEIDPPATLFDPLQAAGKPTWRELELPDPGPEVRRKPHTALPVPTELPWLPATELAALVRAGQVSAQEVTTAYEARIDLFNPMLNVFITRTVGQAGRAAPGRMGLLAGVPVGLKDLIDAAGVTTTCGTRMLEAPRPDHDALAWTKMHAEGAILMGKLNTQEFAAGVTSENDHFGPVRNPWDPSRVSGGSSGGSAVAVAMGLVALSLGTDTGGSVRIPAACCGVVGFKPTFGVTPLRGVQPLAWSLDHLGPITRTVRDAAMCLDVIAGTSCETGAVSGATNGLGGIRVAVPRDWVNAAEPDIQVCFARALAVMESRGATVVEAPSLPELSLIAALNRLIAYAEGSACHEHRLRKGFRYGPLIAARMQAGRFITASQYLGAQRLRRQVCQQIAQVWPVGDLLATPSLPCAAPKLGSFEAAVSGRSEPVGTALVHFTAPFSLTGTPAITVPCGWDRTGLPVGLQLTGPPYSDRLVCFAAAAYEAGRDSAIGSRRPLCSVG
jgi:Asp-tRNA(Asn)/Glu-tRNA(Gln) amidotransferase A subunit family amidase